ncbi:MAG: glycerol kinase, partial [Demequinaceae bacterium]|nr:glycerol kinase [Demequinaceae bacterium]
MSEAQGDDALVVAIDQGTSSTKAVVVDASGRIVGRGSAPLGQSHPAQGWVEQDPRELLDGVRSAVGAALEGVSGTVVAVGLSSQRESALIWDRATGEPLGSLLGWQDRRTSAEAQRLQEAGHSDRVKALTGLPIDPMFSALKFQWLLNKIDPDRARSLAGEICLGTVDSWIVFSLTGEHRIEMGNASRTLLLNIDTGDWDDELLDLFEVPRRALPAVVSSNSPSAPITGLPAVPAGVRFAAVLADSHAALYGHGVREAGAVKVTYGTGSSIMGLLGDSKATGSGLVRTVAWSFGEPVHAFEGNILSAGATAVWLSQLLATTPAELAVMAEGAEATEDLFLVPAFAGLGAPWWDDNARGLITGLTLGTKPADLARAAFESIVFQVEDVLAAADAAMPEGRRIGSILADGGPSANAWLMQAQADISQRSV